MKLVLKALGHNGRHNCFVDALDALDGFLWFDFGEKSVGVVVGHMHSAVFSKHIVVQHCMKELDYFARSEEIGSTTFVVAEFGGVLDMSSCQCYNSEKKVVAAVGKCVHALLLGGIGLVAVPLAAFASIDVGMHKVVFVIVVVAVTCITVFRVAAFVLAPLLMLAASYG